MNKDQITGQAKQAKGEVKELAGKLVGDKAMETKGVIQKTAGKIPRLICKGSFRAHRNDGRTIRNSLSNRRIS